MKLLDIFKPQEQIDADFYRACQDGDVIKARYLIKQMMANVNSIHVDGKTALHIASEKAHFEVLKLLLKNNADVTIKDKNGYLALERANCYALQHIRTMFQEYALKTQAIKTISSPTKAGLQTSGLFAPTSIPLHDDTIPTNSKPWYGFLLC